MSKKVLTVSLLIAIAILAGGGITYAYTATHYIATGAYGPDNTNAILDQHHLYFTNDADYIAMAGGANRFDMGSVNDSIHTGDGDDRLNVGNGNDVIGMASGNDLLDLSSGYDYITFGAYAGWPSTANAVNYISCETPAVTPGLDATMEVRSDTVYITSNTGDVIIQLGNGEGGQSMMAPGGGTLETDSMLSESLGEAGVLDGTAFVNPDGLDDAPLEIQQMLRAPSSAQ